MAWKKTQDTCKGVPQALPGHHKPTQHSTVLVQENKSVSLSTTETFRQLERKDSMFHHAFPELQSWLFNAKNTPSGKRVFIPRSQESSSSIHQRAHCLPRGRGRHRLQTRVSKKKMPLLSLPLRQKPASRKRLLLSFPSQALSSNMCLCRVLKKNTAAPSLSGTARQTCALLGAACLDEDSGKFATSTQRVVSWPWQTFHWGHQVAPDVVHVSPSPPSGPNLDFLLCAFPMKNFQQRTPVCAPISSPVLDEQPPPDEKNGHLCRCGISSGWLCFAQTFKAEKMLSSRFENWKTCSALQTNTSWNFSA